MRGFFSCWTRKEQISRRGVMACRNSTSLSFPERNRGAGMILPRQIAALHAFNLGHGCKGAACNRRLAFEAHLPG